ncbi:hypothetical protein [Rhodovibrio salinarum]|uniref:Lipoprotein n=1 Tax=Rhodovibrio salinarum TaxID=1087 RepID=A0A934QFR9_9PROT|nr:hypothetical protein [Rhodovibrio salinarum]MBK1696166.1 hypothetical protein [Rhodovibrio salinarum]
MFETHRRTGRRVPTLACALLAPALVLAGCAGSEKTLPGQSGIYAKTRGEESRLIRLGAAGHAAQWSSANNLPGNVRLLVANRGMGSDPSLFDDYVTLTRAGWVRSEIQSDGSVQPTMGQQYAVPELAEYRVPISLSYVGRENGLDIVRVTPKTPLEPGLYSIEADPAASQSVSGRFGVQAGQLDRRRYARNHCLDRYAGAQTEYRACDAGASTRSGDPSMSNDARDTQAAAVGEVEQQRLQGPETTDGRTGRAGEDAGGQNAGAQNRSVNAQSDGAGPENADPQSVENMMPGLHIVDMSVDRAQREQGDVLLIRGEVVNADDERHELPGLKGQIVDPRGTVLQRWTFLANARALAPGERTGFTTVRDATEEGGKRVEIRFQIED